MREYYEIIDEYELEDNVDGDHRFANVVYYVGQIIFDLGEDVEQLSQDVDDLRSKVDRKLSTWEKLTQNDDFWSKSRLNQKIIWELVKIKENDSPKNQGDVAREYGLSDARISQLKEFIKEKNLP